MARRAGASADRTTVWVIGDQLTPRSAALEGLARERCIVLMIESIERSRQLPYHKQKLALVWSAMRHFAVELRAAGYEVDYYEVAPDFQGALTRHLRRYKTRHVRLLEAAEYGVSDKLAAAARGLGVTVEVVPNNLFLSDRDAFEGKARGKKTLLMESFYRDMRRKTGLLMDGSTPTGGSWNYDKENRKAPPPGHEFPEIPRYDPDRITRSVMSVVAREFPDHFGELDDFSWPVTRPDAESFLDDFLEHRLDLFGPYEDAIVLGERALYHSLLSPLLNLNLLDPLDVCRRAEERYRKGQARLNSVEGFVRQIIGWREFVYQVYHLRMPGYPEQNFFQADLPLPDFYWSGDTRMRCVADAVSSLRRWGINHHIQRLMVTGNFALIAGLNPQEVNRWYWLAYADAYEWVVTPNVIGMSLFADGGVFATKPYAASANYIQKMSDCCTGCHYNPKKSTEDDACPFNALYWDFLARQKGRLSRNPRMSLVLGLLAKRQPSDLKALRRRAATIRQQIREGQRI